MSHLRAALHERGYFYAANVDVLPEAYIRSIYEYSHKAHALSADVKSRYKQRGGTGAYSGPDIGQLELQYEASGSPAAVCGALPAAAPRHRSPSAEELEPLFASTLDELYSRQDRLALALLGGFEAALELPPRTLRAMFEGGDFGTIRLLHYPGDAAAAEGSKDVTGIGAHTDFECFTLMHQSAPGLQLMPRAPGGVGHGAWTEAPVRPGEFIVIVGDMLERLTNGALLATPHRVLPTAHARSSIIRFNAFAPETLVAPLDAFVTPARPRAYSAVRMRRHMETTMKNLEAGLGSWDVERQRSHSATFEYS